MSTVAECQHCHRLPHTNFFSELFGSKAARDGEVIRRKVRDVERYIGRDTLLAETRRRGYPVVENAGQFVIFCNNEPIRRLS